MADIVNEKLIDQRRICWPNPDATCLEGGCSYCNDNPYRNVSTICNYARKAGILPNRGLGEQEALNAFTRGLRTNWHGRVETRTLPLKPRKL